MTNFGVDDSALSYGGTAMTSQITKTHPALDEANQTEEHVPMGQSLVQQIYTGLTDYGEIPVSGPYSEAAGGCDLVFGAASRAKTYAALVITWGSTKTSTLSQVGIKNYRRTIAAGQVTGYEAVMFVGPGCTMTEA